MNRRQLIACLAATAAGPARGLAQAPGALIGLLSGTTAQGYASEAAAVRNGLAEAGYVGGQNLNIESRWANDDYARLPSLAAELVARGVTLIVAIGTTNSAKAAIAANPALPVVFVIGADPVETGLVHSLARPEANATGTTLYSSALATKRVDILRELVPHARQIAMLINPTNLNVASDARVVEAIAPRAGLSFLAVPATNEREIDTAFASLPGRQVDGLLLSSDALFGSRSAQISALAVRYRVPVLFNNRTGPESGGLISYAADRIEMYRQAGTYAGRILKGAKPADLPVLLPTKFELVINLKVAQLFGLDLSARLLALADDVIE